MHWHVWLDEGRRLMEQQAPRVPPLIAIAEDYASENLRRAPVTVFLQRCAKCQRRRHHVVPGDWRVNPSEARRD